jgi:hypothetical protein
MPVDESNAEFPLTLDLRRAAFPEVHPA